MIKLHFNYLTSLLKAKVSNNNCIVILDAEYINWKGGIDSQSAYNRKNITEVIQISAIKVSPSFQILDTFNTYVKPNQSKPSKRILELIGTNASTINSGQKCSDALLELKKFIGECKAVSYGIDSQILNVISALQTNEDFLLIKNYLNISVLLEQNGFPINNYTSGTLYKYYEKETEEIKEHNSLDDCRSVFSFLENSQKDREYSQILEHLFEDGQKSQITLNILTPAYIRNGTADLSNFKSALETVKTIAKEIKVRHFIYNDGSTDPELNKVIERYSTRTDIEVFYEKGKNKGVIYSLSRLYDKVKKEGLDEDYVLRLNADDLLFPVAIEELLDGMNTTNTSIGYGGGLIFRNNSKDLELLHIQKITKGESLWKHLLNHRAFPHLSICWKLSTFKEIFKDFETGIPYSEDWDHALCTARYIYDNNLNFYTSYLPTYLFRRDDISLGRQQLMDFPGKISSIKGILSKQISGIRLRLHFAKDVFRLTKIRIGIMLPYEYRKFIMPRFTKKIHMGRMLEGVLKYTEPE